MQKSPQYRTYALNLLCDAFHFKYNHIYNRTGFRKKFNPIPNFARETQTYPYGGPVIIPKQSSVLLRVWSSTEIGNKVTLIRLVQSNLKRQKGVDLS